MKIYRGPSQKDFQDDLHQKVAEIDLSSDITPWTDKRTLRGNITKDGIERKAVTHVVLEAPDIIALHRGLVDGLHQQAEQAKSLQRKVESFRKALEDIHRISRIASQSGDPNEAIEKIVARAQKALFPPTVRLVRVKK